MHDTSGNYISKVPTYYTYTYLYVYLTVLKL